MDGWTREQGRDGCSFHLTVVCASRCSNTAVSRDRRAGGASYSVLAQHRPVLRPEKYRYYGLFPKLFFSPRYHVVILTSSLNQGASSGRRWGTCGPAALPGTRAPGPAGGRQSCPTCTRPASSAGLTSTPSSFRRSAATTQANWSGEGPTQPCAYHRTNRRPPPASHRRVRRGSGETRFCHLFLAAMTK